MKQNVIREEAIGRWDRFADVYSANHAEQGDLHKEVLLNPVLFSLIGDVEGRRVLDAGCGEGYLSRLLAKSGADITAVDYSPRMLEIAKERTPANLHIDFLQANCEEMDCLKDNTFEFIVSNMVIQDLENYEKVFEEVYRLLIDGGSFVFSILHPCFVTPKSGWEKTKDGEKLHWNVDNYFYEGVYEQPLGGEEKMILFHRTITSYINASLQAGFTLESLVEPKPSEEMLIKHPSFREDFRCADFLVFKLKKKTEAD